MQRKEPAKTKKNVKQKLHVIMWNGCCWRLNNYNLNGLICLFKTLSSSMFVCAALRCMHVDDLFQTFQITADAKWQQPNWNRKYEKQNEKYTKYLRRMRYAHADRQSRRRMRRKRRRSGHKPKNKKNAIIYEFSPKIQTACRFLL